MAHLERAEHNRSFFGPCRTRGWSERDPTASTQRTRGRGTHRSAHPRTRPLVATVVRTSALPCVGRRLRVLCTREPRISRDLPLPCRA
eukprot:6546356-Prymnesium_polylepis.1